MTIAKGTAASPAVRLQLRFLGGGKAVRYKWSIDTANGLAELRIADGTVETRMTQSADYWSLDAPHPDLDARRAVREPVYSADPAKQTATAPRC